MEGYLFNLRERFIDFSNQLVHRAASIYFQTRKEFPVDEEFIQENTFLSALLFQAVFQIPFDLVDFDALEERDIVRGRELLDEWSALGRQEAVRAYCEEVNHLLDIHSRLKAEREYFLLPNYVAYCFRIRQELDEISKQMTIDLVREKRERIHVL
ncbi:MAG: hypothetical protein II467_01355 [Bacilli bacterium]|nr:hypothetical protein [Bacilli bacterium]MBQ2493751.1 hypothetical protein [Bacilli bacterium]MBQ4182215.1 hypothetical protein [Bacilli bacterium]